LDIPPPSTRRHDRMPNFDPGYEVALLGANSLTAALHADGSGLLAGLPQSEEEEDAMLARAIEESLINNGGPVEAKGSVGVTEEVAAGVGVTEASGTVTEPGGAEASGTVNEAGGAEASGAVTDVGAAEASGTLSEAGEAS